MIPPSARPSGGAAPGLMEQRGVSFALGAFVVAAAFTRDGNLGALALGDGTVRLVDPTDPAGLTTVAVHDGACLALIPGLEPGSLIAGGDDGRLLRLTGTDEPALLGRWAGKWIEAFAINEKQRLLAVAVGKQVQLLGRDHAVVQTLDHPSTATGLAFDPSGQRLAVAHYGGVTLWIAYKDGWKPTLLPWKGSHIAVTWSPSGKFIVSSMQENALHGWRLADKKDMAMRGYPAKIRSWSWAAKGRWLATAGADCAVLWPFKAETGPMGKDPTTLGAGPELATVVAAHPSQNLVAIGYKDGTVLLARIDEGDHLTVREAGLPGARSPISAMAWSPDGRTLLMGAEDGWAGILGLGA